jgi:uncharacterized protein
MKQLTTFFILAYLISWIIWLPLYGPAWGLHGLPVLPFHHGLGGLGPLIAAFLTTWVYHPAADVRRLLLQCLQVKPLLYLAIALFSPTLLALIASAIALVIDKTPFNLGGLFTSREFPDLNLLTFFLYNLVFFGLGEEVGWRGFVLPRMQVKLNALTASLVLTVFWALWHWPLFFYRPGYTSMDVAGAVGWVFSLLTGSILLTWLYNGSQGSVLICAVFHSTVDVVFTADFADKGIVKYMGFLITVWGIVTLVVFRPRNPARGRRVQAGDQESA